MSRLTLTFGIALGLGALAVGTLGPAPSEAAADEDVFAKWDKNYTNAFGKAAKEHRKLSVWCMKNGLQYTSNTVLRGVWAYLPDDAETRKHFGYTKRDGLWVQEFEAKGHFRNDFIDDADPQGDKMRKNRDRLQKKISDSFLKLARNARGKARKAGEQDGGAEIAAQWKERETKAYQPVLDLLPGVERHKLEAHRRLGHPKFGGKYVTPYALKHMEARAQRQSIGGEIAAKGFAAKAIAATGPIGTLEFENAAGAESTQWQCNNVWGVERAKRVVQVAEMVLEDTIRIFGLEDDFRAAVRLEAFEVMQSREQVLEYLEEKGWDEARIEKATKYSVSFTNLQFAIMTRSEDRENPDQTGSNARYHLSKLMSGWAKQTVGGWRNWPEDWYWIVLGYDVTMRLFGTHDTHWMGDPDYGRALRANPDEDAWIAYAREQVMLDDDVPLSLLWKHSLKEQDFGAREITKGYALTQYLFESDEKKAQDFFLRAAAMGTPQAAMDVYGAEIIGPENVPREKLPAMHDEKEVTRVALPPRYNEVLDAIDTRYRKWLLKAW